MCVFVIICKCCFGKVLRAAETSKVLFKFSSTVSEKTIVGFIRHSEIEIETETVAIFHQMAFSLNI